MAQVEPQPLSAMSLDSEKSYPADTVASRLPEGASQVLAFSSSGFFSVSVCGALGWELWGMQRW